MEKLPLTKEEEGVMLRQIWEEFRYVRKKLDTHVDQNDNDFKDIKEDVESVKNELTGHKIKLGLMFSAIGVALAGVVSWLVNHVDRVP